MKRFWFIFLCCLSIVNYGYSQRYKLVLQSDNRENQNILSQVRYLKEHKDSIQLFNEVKRISEYLKTRGYFFNQINRIERKELVFNAYYDLGMQTPIVTLKIDQTHTNLINVKQTNDTIITFPIERLQPLLEEITSTLDGNGYSFSKTQLKEIITKGDTLQAKLVISKSNKRYIDKVLIKGYDNFPKSFLRHHYELSNKKPFNIQVLNQISKKTKLLPFATEIRKPEVLFKEDSTLIYMSLEKKPNNSLDGLLNFVTEDNGDLLLTGNLNLSLHNLFNKGESINLFWNSAGNERQEFFIKSKFPYLFGTKISSETNFHIYRQDSSFANTNFNTSLLYNLTNSLRVGLSFSTEKSITTGNASDFTNYSNLFSGIDLRYSTESLSVRINPELGRRTTDNITNQFKLQSDISYTWKITNKSHIFIQNRTGILNSNNYLINELYRIGGANSIRGFNEQEFFTENYSYLNTEFRFLTNSQSYLYTITDYGKLFNNASTTDVLGLGVGYVFRKKNLEIDLNLAVGRRNNQEFDLNNSKLIVSWINFF